VRANKKAELEAGIPAEPPPADLLPGLPFQRNDLVMVCREVVGTTMRGAWGRVLSCSAKKVQFRSKAGASGLINPEHLVLLTCPPTQAGSERRNVAWLTSLQKKAILQRMNGYPALDSKVTVWSMLDFGQVDAGIQEAIWRLFALPGTLLMGSQQTAHVIQHLLIAGPWKPGTKEDNDLLASYKKKASNLVLFVLTFVVVLGDSCCCLLCVKSLNFLKCCLSNCKAKASIS
jgi:hypothetical protein